MAIYRIFKPFRSNRKLQKSGKDSKKTDILPHKIPFTVYFVLQLICAPTPFSTFFLFYVIENLRKIFPNMDFTFNWLTTRLIIFEKKRLSSCI